MDYSVYLKNSKESIFASSYLYDTSLVVRELLHSEKIVEDKKGNSPVLKGDYGKIDLSDKGPYILGRSKHFESLMNMVNERDEFKKGVSINHNNSADNLVGKSAIFAQYALLEDYEFGLAQNLFYENIEQISGRKFSLKEIQESGYEDLRDEVVRNKFNDYQFKSPKKRLYYWMDLGLGGSISEDVVSLYEKMSIRRNCLTHNPDCTPSSIEESVVYFFFCNKISQSVARFLKDSSITLVPEGDFLNSFSDLTDVNIDLISGIDWVDHALQIYN